MNKKYFEELCQKTQSEMKEYLFKKLSKAYPKVEKGNGYIFAQGEVPILLVAHMDTVHKEKPVKFVYDKGKVSSPQGLGADDRAGIYMILEIIKKHNCSVLFCEDEEIGCVGAKKFVTNAPFVTELKFNYLIELDRKGSNDAVFYDCDNKEFKDFILADEDWKLAYGSFTDICTLAPVLGCAAVNLSCGYYNAHTLNEYLVMGENDKIIKNVCKLIERTKETDKFEWVEAVYERNSYGGYYGSLFQGYGSSLYDDEVYEEVEEEYTTKLYWIEFQDEANEDSYEEIYAVSEYEAIGKFLATHPTLSFNHITYIDCFGEDPYAM